MTERNDEIHHYFLDRNNSIVKFDSDDDKIQKRYRFDIATITYITDLIPIHSIFDDSDKNLALPSEIQMCMSV
jgi:hypothetical protein